jgi:hypothetical protein
MNYQLMQTERLCERPLRDELGVDDTDPFSPKGSNFNLLIDVTNRDRVSGIPSHDRIFATFNRSGDFLLKGSRSKPSLEADKPNPSLRATALRQKRPSN